MNNIKMAIALIALTTAFSFADDGMKIGARAGFNLINYSTGNSDMDKNIDMGMSFGAGAAINIPLTSSLKLQPEVAFYYRKPYSMETPEVSMMGIVISPKMESSYTEFAISVPIMVQFYVIDALWLGAGIELDLPLSSEIVVDDKGTKDEHRATLDFGIPVGLGYMIMPNLGVDLRCVIGLTGTQEEYEVAGVKVEDKSSWMQFGLGVSYFF
jgi:hypothetical protein